jgi:predicted phosphoribosyltransferase/SHS2 domain-containing protein
MLMIFDDREQAARLLAERLAAHAGQDPLVLAVPRGAVPMGRVIAERLGGELDVVLVRKLGAPGEPEFALGAVDEGGRMLLNADALTYAKRDWLEAEAAREFERIRARRAQYTPVRAPIDPSGRVVIVVDDGVATGATLVAALRAVRACGPSRLIAATAVAAPDALARLADEADEVVCLDAPRGFAAVGQFFRDFSQVEDDAVIGLLAEPVGHAYFDHEADVGIEAVGATPEAAFVAAARGMFAIMAELDAVRPQQGVSFEFDEPDLELALVTWLNRLLTEARTHGLVFSRFRLCRAGDGHWIGEAVGEPWRDTLVRGTEVKGATFTALALRQEQDLWRLRCVVDV